MSINNKILQNEPIAEIPDGIILGKYEPQNKKNTKYQTEKELEDQLISDLANQGYERLHIYKQEDLEINIKEQIQRLNNVVFNDDEWTEFKNNYLLPSNGKDIKSCTRRIQEDEIYTFKFDDGSSKNIKIFDKKDIYNNSLQFINQMQNTGLLNNQYDVTILINGLPIVQIVLKRPGVDIRAAFNQIQRYKKESYNNFYNYIQIFVISNGTFTSYLANTNDKNKDQFKFSMNWADVQNNVINDLNDFTTRFFEKRTLLQIITKYCVFTKDGNLLVMRPYQIAATERILWKINSSNKNKIWGNNKAGGYIWHTTGSGKTLTSFKAALLASRLENIDKVLFIVDRKDLDNQTLEEFKKYDEDSVIGSNSTQNLKNNFEKSDRKIIITTIHKMKKFIDNNPDHPVYQKHCVLIYDECHRSQTGTFQKKIASKFKKHYQFGFTGTPIFRTNAINNYTTEQTFGALLHQYVLLDAIRNKKVLKFKVDYIETTGHNNNERPRIKRDEQDEENVDYYYDIQQEKLLKHPNRIQAVSEHILKVYNTKTARIRTNEREKGFNALLATTDIEAARKYYETLKKLQKDKPKEEQLRIATIFSYQENPDRGDGDIEGEDIEIGQNIDKMELTDKQFLMQTIDDYNKMFENKNMNYSIQEFNEYYQDVSKRTKKKEIDLLIVVNMFLTGFDAPTLNTLFVDKNLKYHGLIQAFSRTNRIFNDKKTFGNIVCFRDLKEQLNDALRLFSVANDKDLYIYVERGYNDYFEGYKTDDGVHNRGYKEVCEELISHYPDPSVLENATDEEKKKFVDLYNEFIKLRNILSYYDEFGKDEKVEIIGSQLQQDLQAAYLRIKDDFNKKRKADAEKNIPNLNDEIIFHTELISTDEINIDYILKLVYDWWIEIKKHNIIKEHNIIHIKKTIGDILSAHIDYRHKKNIFEYFIDSLVKNGLAKDENFEEFNRIFLEFTKNKKQEKIENLISEEFLTEGTYEFIEECFRNKKLLENTSEKLNRIVPPTHYTKLEAKKEQVLEKIRKIVEEFEGL
ncbi:type I restriction endonuclease subunit R [Ureaplasma sp. ES3154-GEN]|uniref:type I restriction endonuclease subunit R n=1 Tax=Ureaplasma sp. ES3154-GEN TaxID=2984844 RepID=UPI0021E91B85|nr:type I restriction endonuclease subunit R [Ureaplasma sp. ES3154-GEN]MCV3743556.1 type I restriction endonuclease subunit R [Ureaplasma sp. ES3154-GEN]